MHRDEADVYDVVVIGGGPGGEDATLALLREGLSVALVEAELLGGECFNWACVPSKALLRAGHAVRASWRLPGAREATSAPLDASAVLRHRDDLVLHHDDAEPAREFERAGATVVRGVGRVVGDRQVVVTTPTGHLTLSATHGVVLATGSVPSIPAIPGLAEARPWTNREATSATQVPPRLTVLGSGASGLELAQAWSTLGSRVTVLSRQDTLLPSFEPYVGELVLTGLRGSGVDVRFGVRAVEVARTDTGVAVRLDDGSTLVSDELLVATGKKATTGSLGLESVGVHGDGYLEVDDFLTVGGLDWLYAIGDVNGRALMTHEATYQARIVASAIGARSRGDVPSVRAEADGSAIPQVVFTDPAVAVIGLTRARAEAEGLDAQYVEVELGRVQGARLHAKDYVGRVSWVVDLDARVVVGATFVGQDVADLVHAATMAIVGRVPVDRLRHVVPSFPTMSEVWLDLVDSVIQQHP